MKSARLSGAAVFSFSPEDAVVGPGDVCWAAPVPGRSARRAKTRPIKEKIFITRLCIDFLNEG
jgi:hypothetical protein